MWSICGSSSTPTRCNSMRAHRVASLVPWDFLFLSAAFRIIGRLACFQLVRHEYGTSACAGFFGGFFVLWDMGYGGAHVQYIHPLNATA